MITFYDNIDNISRNVRSVTFVETAKKSNEGEYLPLKIRSKNRHSNKRTLKSMFTIR